MRRQLGRLLTMRRFFRFRPDRRYVVSPIVHPLSSRFPHHLELFFQEYSFGSELFYVGRSFDDARVKCRMNLRIVALRRHRVRPGTDGATRRPTSGRPVADQKRSRWHRRLQNRAIFASDNQAREVLGSLSQPFAAYWPHTSRATRPKQIPIGLSQEFLQ